MDIADITVGDKLFHKHHRKIVTITNVYISPDDPDKHFVECYRNFNEKPMYTHPSLLELVNPGIKTTA